MRFFSMFSSVFLCIGFFTAHYSPFVVSEKNCVLSNGFLPKMLRYTLNKTSFHYTSARNNFLRKWANVDGANLKLNLKSGTK